MAKKDFELRGFLVGHPDFPDAQPGDVLRLEVGDDGLPTSELLRQRTRPLADRKEAEGEAMTDKEAKGKAKEIIDGAKASAKEIIAKAETDAAEYVKDMKAKADKALEDATVEAQKLIDAAKP